MLALSFFETFEFMQYFAELVHVGMVVVDSFFFIVSLYHENRDQIIYEIFELFFSDGVCVFAIPHQDLGTDKLCD